MSAGSGSAGLHWARVAKRRLRLADEAEIQRQELRGRLWYFVRDEVGDRYYRFSPAVYHIMVLLDGHRTVDEAFALVSERLGEDAPSELEVMKLLWRLHAADLLRGDVTGRTEEIVERAESLDRRKLLLSLRSPLAVRIPLFDPSRMLERLSWLARIVYSPFGFAIWCVTLLTGLSSMALNWTAFTTNFSDRVLSFDNLLLVWLVFPVVKFLHEVGHGLALQRWKRASHEMGIMFLVFMPVPYIDASSSTLMQRPRQRMIVGAGGLYFELFLASLAMIAWTMLEPGVVRAVAYNTVLIGGASALLFNGNPLLKFDAYYVLSDAIEIPNLGTRSANWWLWLIQKRVLRLEDAENPVEAKGEVGWLAAYAPLSIGYRLSLVFTIAIFVAKKLFFLGTALALLAVFNIIILPLWRGLVFLVRSPRLKRGRPRAIVRIVGLGGAMAALLLWLPVPYRTVAQGVVWYSEGAEIRPGASGYVQTFDAQSGDMIEDGASILSMDDPETQAELKSLRARVVALEAQYRRELSQDRDKSRLTAEEVAYIRERIAASEDRLAGLTVRAPAKGRLIIPRQRDLEGGWIGRGALLGHVVGNAPMKVRAVLRQADMELVARDLEDIAVRFASTGSQTVEAQFERINPQTTDILPSAILATVGGGPFSLRQSVPGDSGPRAIERVFLIEIDLPEGAAPIFGERAYVRFSHGTAPLGVQLLRSLRQLFLREFEV